MAKRIVGLDKLLAKFKAMPKTVRAQLVKDIATSADEIVRLQKQLVPVDKGDLRDSIGWTWGDPPKGAVFTVSSGGALTEDAEGFRATIYAGNEKAYYARWVEFGVAAQRSGSRITNKAGRSRKSARTTKGQNAQPFFYNSYRLLKKRAQSRIARGIGKAVKQVAGTGK